MVNDKKDLTKLEGASSFIWWAKYEYDGTVRKMKPQDLPLGYESNYMRCWNYVRDKGWEKINNWWINADGSRKYKTVYEAYQSQKFKELQKS